MHFTFYRYVLSSSIYFPCIFKEVFFASNFYCPDLASSGTKTENGGILTRYLYFQNEVHPCLLNANFNYMANP